MSTLLPPNFSIHWTDTGMFLSPVIPGLTSKVTKVTKLDSFLLRLQFLRRPTPKGPLLSLFDKVDTERES